MKTKIRITEDVYDQYNKRVIAGNGRFGWIDKEDASKIGQATHIRVNLDGNKIRHDLPAWKMERAK